MRFLIIVALIIILLLPSFAPYNPQTTQANNILSQPNIQHLLGTDHLGRDVLSRLLAGTRLTIFMGLVVTCLASSIGIFLGLVWGISGWFGQQIFFILINAILSIPQIVVALVIITILGKGIIPVAVAVGISQLPLMTRVARDAVLRIRHLEFVTASHGFGANELHIAWFHILPNILPTVSAYAAITFGYGILQTAGLGFLGLIGEPGTPELGAMVSEARSSFRFAPWVAIAPGVMLFAITYIANELADRFAKPKL